MIDDDDKRWEAFDRFLEYIIWIACALMAVGILGIFISEGVRAWS